MDPSQNDELYPIAVLIDELKVIGDPKLSMNTFRRSNQYTA
jgi:hypothetical protein